MIEASPRFDSFIMFAEMRTGSNFLEANLNALPGVTCLGEIFNPHFIGKKDQTELFGITIEERDADPQRLLGAVRENCEGLVGFRYFHDHDQRIFEPLLNDPRCAKIVLTRNPVESYVSWKIAQTTGQWKLTNVKNLRTGLASFDPREFEEHLEKLQQFQIRILHGLQVTGQTAFYLDYEDIQDVAVINGLAAFLGVEGRLEAIDNSLKKQNPEEIERKVRNPEEMEAALARLDRFNLGRTPNFEPRRSPSIPSYVAGAGVPLLYMPVACGPETAVTTWLSQLGNGLEQEFTLRRLRKWKQQHPRHRSFTVLRHPLLRAHVAFRERMLTGSLPEQRIMLKRLFKAELPRPGKTFDDVAAHQAAFLAFLRYAKLSVAGQTGIRVDRSWASQTAVLQGFAGHQGPDLVLREERLNEGLAFLAREIGLESVPEIAPDGEAVQALEEIWLPEMETLAEEAWARDYHGFGFRRWKAE